MASRWPTFSVNPEYIHIGPWTNWNDDYSNGGRITVTKEAADLIMIFTGILFVFMESGLCSLVTLVLFWYHRHQRRPRPVRRKAPASSSSSASESVSNGQPPHDVVWHQRQTMLRNSGDFLSIVGRSMAQWLTYRRRLKHKLWSSTSLVLLTTAALSLLTAGVFIVALPFLTTFMLLHEEGNEVLIWSERCGLWDANMSSNAWTIDATNRWHTAIQYADACYMTDSPSEMCDNYFVNRTIAATLEDVDCPMANSSVCLDHRDGDGDRDTPPAVQITTTGIDSHRDLGLNADPSDRIHFNRTVTCAPIDLTGKRSTDDGDLMQARLGNIDGFDNNITFQAYRGRTGETQRFTLHGVEQYMGWTPIEELSVPDAYVSVVFLHNPGIAIKGQEKGPYEDPFFNATIGYANETYLPAKPITSIGCIERFTFQNPNNAAAHVTTIVPWDNIYTDDRIGVIENKTKDIGDELQLNPKQRATLHLTLWGLTNAGSIGEMVGTVGVSALRAAKDPGTWFWAQNPLPRDQWKREVRYWVDIGLAALQQEFVRFATGPRDSEGLIPGPNQVKDELCNLQKIKQTAFENFRRPGFIALATVGAFLIIVPWVVIRLILWVGQRRGWLFVLEWVSYGELQLLRMANEGAGVHGWQGCDEEVPFVDAEEIAHVDMSDVKHPRMMHYSSMEMEGAAGHTSVHSASSTARLLGQERIGG